MHHQQQNTLVILAGGESDHQANYHVIVNNVQYSHGRVLKEWLEERQAIVGH